MQDVLSKDKIYRPETIRSDYRKHRGRTWEFYISTQPSKPYSRTHMYSVPHLEGEWKISGFEITVGALEIAKLDYRFVELYTAIEKSKYILELPHNHDGRGSKAYGLETWKKACLFLIDLNSYLYNKAGIKSSVPNIYHGPNGSIDIQWEQDEFKLLINVPEGNDDVTFYGTYNNGQEIEGAFNLKDYKIQLLPIVAIF
ncbi:hypothetical protein [Lewinella sp. JB7]|uniref:hypothetical protein n=1 Tax=Lewinella sp. JB7 TaxID=2962887 RepID=UPI0020C9D238|nr:hypothetical protein [Lewinella sp. JB7]MCP9237943.1 hypothetical protein [Lewinella sp. JB7]